MQTITAFIKRHPLLSFYAGVFVISWGGVLAVIGGPGGFGGTPEQFKALLPRVGLAMLAGPVGAGLLLTGLVDGRAGYRELLARLFRWRGGAQWYTLALLTAPLLYLALLLPLSLVSAKFVPRLFAAGDRAFMVVFGMAFALGAGFFEEIGWTGFAVPMLRRRHGVLATGLIAGVLWATWHWLVQLWAPGASAGGFSVTILLADPLFYLVGYRVLMVWVYDRTGSLLMAILMHLGLTASALILNPVGFEGIAGMTLLTFDLAWAAAVWAVVAVVALASGGHLSRQPPLRRRTA